MKNISINKIHPFEGHPYKVLDNEEMNNLIQSVQEYGVMSPLIVRPLENKIDEYEIISGHRRFRAAQKAGLTEVPAYIYAVNRDEAAIMLVDSNLHREHILPSEKAFAYKMKMEALKRQGKRTDLTLSQVATKLDTASEIGRALNESRDQVFRYIRLTYLIPELLDLMDEGKIAFSVGVELSYIDDNVQYALLDIIERDNCTPSYSQAFHMHKAMREGRLTMAYIEDLMSQEKPNQRETIKLSSERIRSYVPKKYNAKQTEDFIIKALEHYNRYLKRQRERDWGAR
ncbi:MAG: ParB/RepB/Spo0J family partition protein [Ruminococcaceae bacterium]|nr:ParB/RepB/Spo0J family partition protein [Oscillospiraceae bacterium]